MPKLTPSALAAKLYLNVWRWHFWMGLIVAPILIAVSVTGALYVFKDNLERVMYPGLMFVEPRETQVSHSTLEEALSRELPEAELHYISVSQDPTRAWSTFLEMPDPAHPENKERSKVIYAYFNQYTGELIGFRPSNEGFFRIILNIHRRLLTGTPGRLVVEIATAWGIISMLTGLYLWWPRKKEKIWGVWLPRVRGGFRSVLRDWHTVLGVYISIFVLLIMGTGLFFTNIWGTGFRAITAISGGFPAFYISPPQSASVDNHEDHTRISLDEAFAAANKAYPFEGRSYGIDLPHHDTNDSFNIVTDIADPFSELGTTYIDQYTGELLRVATSSDLPWMTHLILLFYPIHVGSIFGLPTQILAVLSCLAIIAMSATGVWMWWRRRPPGQLGAPRKGPPGITPGWVTWLTVCLAMFLPTVGLTLLLIWIIGLIGRRISFRRR